MSWLALSGSIEQGLVYGIMALGVYLTFRILDFPDLTVEGTFPMGAAITAVMVVNDFSPGTAMLAALIIGMLAGALTGIIHTKMRITGLLAGILTMTALYSVNLRIMGRPNISLLRMPTIFSQLEDIGFSPTSVKIVAFAIIAIGIKILLDLFLGTEFGLALRATGDNPHMIRSFGVSTDRMIITGLALSNGLVALSGSLVTQYQGYADASMGLGMIVTGLASVILGNALIRSKSIFWGTFGVLVGSVLYRLAIFFALRAGFAPTDLKIVTAVIVIFALAAPAIHDRYVRFRSRARRRRQQKEDFAHAKHS